MNSSKLIEIIRKIVKEEVKRVAKPLINEVLADRFLQTLNEKKESVMSEVFNIKDSVPQKQQKQDRAKLREELLKKVAGDDPMKQLIFGDVESVPGISNVENNIPGSYVDSDDEGVDLSKFGL